jgi:hypothetical protein
MNMKMRRSRVRTGRSFTSLCVNTNCCRFLYFHHITRTEQRTSEQRLLVEMLAVLCCKYFRCALVGLPIRVAERSKGQVCGRLLAGIAGSNPARDMDVCVASKDKRQNAGQSGQRNKYG